MAAVLERTDVHTIQPCDSCTGVPEPAAWFYRGDRARHGYLCLHHYDLYKASIDTRPASYARLRP